AGTYNVSVNVTDGTLSAPADTFTWTVSAANTAPVVDTATVSPAGPTTGQTLTASFTAHDAEGDTLTPSYQWTKNGTNISGATSSTLNLATAGNGDKGDLIRVIVTVSDGSLSSAPLTSSPATVANSAPVFTTDLVNRTDTVGDVVSLDADATDADTDTLTYSATNLPAGITIASGTGLIGGTLAAGSQGTYNVSVNVTDGTLSAVADTFTWTVNTLNTAPVVDTATVAPTSPTTGQTLTASFTAHDAEGDTLTPSYQWTKNGTNISGATSSTLNLALAGNGDKGDLIRVIVTVSDGSLSSAPLTSSPATVANSAPVFTTDLVNRTDTVGDVVSLDADATDADTDTLTSSATHLPAGTTTAPRTGLIGGTLAAGSQGT